MSEGCPKVLGKITANTEIGYSCPAAFDVPYIWIGKITRHPRNMLQERAENTSNASYAVISKSLCTAIKFNNLGVGTVS